MQPARIAILCDLFSPDLIQFNGITRLMRYPEHIIHSEYRTRTQRNDRPDQRRHSAMLVIKWRRIITVFTWSLPLGSGTRDNWIPQSCHYNSILRRPRARGILAATLARFIFFLDLAAILRVKVQTMEEGSTMSGIRDAGHRLKSMHGRMRSWGWAMGCGLYKLLSKPEARKVASDSERPQPDPPPPHIQFPPMGRKGPAPVQRYSAGFLSTDLRPACISHSTKFVIRTNPYRDPFKPPYLQNASVPPPAAG